MASTTMMIVQDFGLSNHAMEMWKQEEGKRKSRKTGAGRYFLRLQMSHMFEAFDIIKDEIEKSEILKKAIAACDERTRNKHRFPLRRKGRGTVARTHRQTTGEEEGGEEADHRIHEPDARRRGFRLVFHAD